MKVQELVELVNKNDGLDPEQTRELLKEELEVKEYIGFREKQKLVEDIVQKCTTYEHGAFKIDEIEKYMRLIMSTVDAYTNLELSDDIIEDYDVLCSTGILSMVIDTFREERDEVMSLVQMTCNSILYDNCTEVQIAKFFAGLLLDVDNISDKIIEVIGTIDLSDFSIDDIIGQIDTEKIASVVNMIQNQLGGEK